MTGSLVGTGNNQNEIPEAFELKQNYPNPFNPETIIEFSISKNTYSELKVFDVIGNEVAVLEKGELNAGHYSYKLSAEQLPSGVYFYTLKTADFTQTKKMLLLK